MENEKQHELLKLQTNWAERRKVAANREGVFLNNIVPQMREKQRFQDTLHLKYKQEVEDKYQDEQIKRSSNAWNLKNSHMQAIAKQLQEQRAATEMARRNEADADKRQLDFKVAEDEAKLKEEAAMNQKRRNHARGLMLEAEENARKLEAEQINGASRGEKMSKEEYKFNKELLREVAKIKKEGHFVNISQRCTSTKITNFDV